MTNASPKRQTASQRALIALRQMLVEGAFPVGERLYEADLSERLELSRTPLREALTRLSEEGLVETTGSVGFHVRGFTRQDVSDALELRGCLEGLSVRLAAERGPDPAALEEARDAALALDPVVRDRTGIDLEAYATGNERFHLAMARMCGGGIVGAQIDRVCRLPFGSPMAFLHARAGLSDFERSLVLAQEHHLAILRAVEAGEGARAEALAREHARLARDNIERALERADETGIDPAGLTRLIR